LLSISPPLPGLRTLEDVTPGKCQVVSEGGGAIDGNISLNNKTDKRERGPRPVLEGESLCLQTTREAGRGGEWRS
jgi:hypothetical protein